MHHVHQTGLKMQLETLQMKSLNKLVSNNTVQAHAVAQNDNTIANKNITNKRYPTVAFITHLALINEG